MRGDKTRDAVERLESLRWHILRLDGFRTGLWNRAGIILSTNALVAGASAVLISVGSRAGHLTLITAALAMVAVLVSVYEAMGVGGASRQWLGSYEDKQSPPAFIYAVSETMTQIENFGDFQKALSEWTERKEIEAAASEVWRLEVLHHRRVLQLMRSIRWLFTALILLTVSAVVTVFNNWPHA